MGEKKTVEVKIADIALKIKTEVEPKVVEELTQYINKKVAEVRETTRLTSPVHLLALTSLNLTEELFGLKKRTFQTEGYKIKFTQMIDKINTTLETLPCS